MSALELKSLSPLIVLSLGILCALLSSAFFRRTRLSYLCTLLGLFLAFGTLFVAPNGQSTSLLRLDDFAKFFVGLSILASIAVATWAREGHEFHILLFLATMGAATLAMSVHFASFFLGLEVLTVSLYGMVGYSKDNERSTEAAVKYLILAGVSSAFLLFGIALLYGTTGTLAFSPWPASGSALIFGLGSALLLVGIGFKLAVVPFHMWIPDVYQGAPTPAAAFIASASKASVLAVLIRFATLTGLETAPAARLALTAIAIASMFVGNGLALFQNSLKRILAYSSISHFGYMLVAFIAGGRSGSSALLIYIVVYVISILAAFGVIAAFENAAEGPRDRLEDYRGLFAAHPYFATILIMALLSLAGIPLTAGFIGKFFVFTAGIDSALWALVLLIAANSAIGIFYYLRVVVVLVAPTVVAPGSERNTDQHVLRDRAIPGLLLFLLVAVGVYPSPLLRLAGEASLVLSATAADPQCKYIAAGETETTGAVRLKAAKWLTGLEVPWSLAFLPNGNALLTERPGRLRRITDGKLDPNPIYEVSTVQAGEGGLLGLAVDPRFSENRFIYIYRTLSSGAANQVERLKLSNDERSATLDQVIVSGIPAGMIHDGGRLRFGPDGKLFITTGETHQPSLSQNPSNLGGKILRINTDGSIPNDNPISDSRVYVEGIRNCEGFDWIRDGLLVVADHGPTGELGLTGNDEINIAGPGDNLGWPTIHGCQTRPGLITPILSWENAVPPGGLLYYRGSLLKDFAHSVLVATLGSNALYRLVFSVSTNDISLVRHEVYFKGQPPQGYGRLRDIVQGPDDAIYITTSNCDGRGVCPPDGDVVLRVAE